MLLFSMTRLFLGAVLLTAISLTRPLAAKDNAYPAARVQLLDFSGTPGTRGEAIDSLGKGATRTRLVDDFNKLGTGSGLLARAPFAAIDLISPAYRKTAFVHSPPIVLPKWMRGSGVTPAGSWLLTSLPTMGACGGGSYSSSRLLRAPAEERRRLLYPLVVQSACRYGIPVGLFDAMIIQESGYRPFIRSPKGAFGLGQLLPGTAAELGVDPYNVYGNLDGSARYLASHLREFREPRLALAAYNAGPGRVRKVRRIPRIAETQDYVRSILWNWQKLEWQSGR